MTTKEQLEKEQAELKAELDELKARLAKANNDYDKFKELLQQEGLSDAQKQEYKEERAAAERQQAEMRQQRDPLLARISKLDDLLNPPPVPAASQNEVLMEVPMNNAFKSLVELDSDSVSAKKPKRLLLLDDEILSDGVARFIRHALTSRLPLKDQLAQASSAPLTNRVVNLGMELNAKRGFPQWILFRQCYSDYYTKHIRPALLKGTNIFIGGAQGIGKSVLGDILALLLAEEGEVVLFHHFTTKILIVGETPNPKAIAKVKAILGSAGYDPDSLQSNGPAVYTIESSLFDRLSIAEHLVVVQDLGDMQDNVVSYEGGAKRIWVSSPNTERLKVLRGDGLKLNLYVPPVTLEEMLAICNHWNPHQYTEEQVKTRFLEFGGSVRFVLELSEEDARDRFEGAIAGATNATLSEIFGRSFLDLPKGALSGTLLHARPLANNPTRFRLHFASAEIGKRLFDKFISGEQRRVGTFLAASVKEPSLSVFAGYVLEANVHDEIRKGVTVKAKKLHRTAALSAADEKNMTLPRLELGRPFSQEDFTDIPLEELKVNVYFRPSHGYFPTLDSFVILPSKVVPGGAERGLCLVTIQSTKAKAHGMEGNILERLCTRVEAALKARVEKRYHFFVTGSNGIRTKQTMTMKNLSGQDYSPGYEPAVEQWAITLGNDFNTLYDLLEKAEESGDPSILL